MFTLLHKAVALKTPNHYLLHVLHTILLVIFFMVLSYSGKFLPVGAESQ
jgi:hypothetical protein